MENNDTPVPEQNAVLSLLFIPTSIEKYKYYVNTNFQQPRSIKRDDVYRFIRPYLDPKETTKVLDWLSARKIIFLDATSGTVIELVGDYDVTRETLRKQIQDNKLSDALADKQERESQIIQRKPIVGEERFEKLVGTMYTQILGTKEDIR